MTNPTTYDYIIIGSGIAGLYTALLARQAGGSILILTKGSTDETNTKYAQGGIAAAIGQGDSPELHYQDTMAAGAGLCDPEAVRLLAQEAPDRITDLIRFGVPFDTEQGEVALAREGAHSLPRVLHAGGDATGEHIEISLSNLARLSNITILEYSLATRILMDGGAAQGVEVLDARTHTRQQYEGRFLVLATGGAGRLYKLSTNPDIATGDGVALAFRAGAEIVDMEFFQFHPTALRLPGVQPFLISEAVRGEGGLLRNIHGQRFMPNYASQAELAARDVVARSIDQEMVKTGADHVLLDVTHLPPHFVPTRFPTIFRFCLDHGLDITRQPIPVAPAAHYTMGGVKTNLWGETNIPRLFACGETASTGVHGANRLASNSLMEVLVFSKRIVQRTQGQRMDAVQREMPPCETFHLPQRAYAAHRAGLPSLATLQALLWEKVGMVRARSSLEQAADTLAAWESGLGEPTDRPTFELSNLAQVGRLVTEAALLREESRGAHYRSDFPDPSDRWLKRIVFRQAQ